MINGEAIERGEQKLANAVQITRDPNSLFDIAKVERQAFERLVQHHWTTIRASMPELDPRVEPTMNTAFMHFFLVGVLCGRSDK